MNYNDYITIRKFINYIWKTFEIFPSNFISFEFKLMLGLSHQ